MYSDRLDFFRMPMKTLYLDAGHTQGKDPGAVALGTTEHEEVARLADQVMELLHLPGWEVAIVPKGLLLPGKIAWINQHATEEDVLISLHMNSASPAARGVEVYYYGGSDGSRARGEELLGCLANSSPLRARGVKDDRGTRHKRLGIVRDTRPWAFLVEYGFVTSKEDLDVVRTRGARDLAGALAAWLARW